MKRILALAAATILAATFVSGCKKEDSQADVKTGLGVVTTISKSTDVKEGTGVAQVDSVAAAVTVDKDGRIVKCVIDSAQTRINFDATGKITTPLDTGFKTKNELGAEYGMKKASGIGKEWNEQAAAFAKYVEGKTANEIAAIAVDESKHPTGADLTASVTMSVGDHIEAVKKAIDNAKNLGAKGSDKLGLGIVTTIGNSKDASGTENGVAQAYSTYAVTTADKDGKITSSVIDASQTNVNFDATGKIKSDLNAVQKTKNELGDAYNMKKVSGIGKEWNEQAAAFAKYVVGKKAGELDSIAVDDAGHPTGLDLKSSVTVAIGDFINVVKKAAAGAK